MKRKSKILIFGSLLIVSMIGYFLFDCLHKSKSEILEEALSLGRTSKGIFLVQKTIVKVENQFSQFKRVVDRDFSRENLSFFVMKNRSSLFIPKEYEFYYSTQRKMIDGCASYLEKYDSVISISDIKEQEWEWQGKHFKGSFSFKTSYGFSGRMLFEGKDKKITKLVIAKKGSDELEEGYAVFGCKYGLNALAEEIYDELVCLPESEVGEYITFDNYNPDSLTISMRSDGTINVCGRIISMKMLDQILENVKKQYTDSTVSVFLRIDKDCSEANASKLKDLIEPYNFEIHQVFYKKDENYPVAVKSNE